MGEENPWLLGTVILVGGTVAKWWWDDVRAADSGRPNPRAFPGASRVSHRAMLVAIAGALLLLAIETTGEDVLGLTAVQSRMTGLFALYTLAAAFAEELVFRGYLVVPNRGRAALVASIMGASLVFALIHPFLWEWHQDSLRLRYDDKARFSALWAFAGSLWFYTVRFMPMNPSRSLLPCVAAHLARNVGVIGIKYAQGFIVGWW